VTRLQLQYLMGFITSTHGGSEKVAIHGKGYDAETHSENLVQRRNLQQVSLSPAPEKCEKKQREIITTRPYALHVTVAKPDWLYFAKWLRAASAHRAPQVRTLSPKLVRNADLLPPHHA